MGEGKTGDKIIQATLVITIVTILSKIAAFCSATVLAYYLGTSGQSDAFNTVYSVEQVVYPMLGVGVWKVFLPLYKEKIVNNNYKDAADLANRSIVLFFTITFVVVLLLDLFCSFFVTIIAPGFSDEIKNLTVRLIRISSPMYLFIVGGAIYSAMLQSHNKFFASQIREVVTHIPLILFAVLFYKVIGINALAVGLLLGGVCRMLVELPFVDWGYHFHFDYRINTGDMRLLLSRYPSAMLSEGAGQINILVDKIMASTLAVGSVSALSYSSRLLSVLNGLLSVALSTALYPQFVELKELNEYAKLESIIKKVINTFCFVMIPVSIGCLAFSSEIVSAVYERGMFNQASVSITADTFSFYCVGLFFVACNTVLINVFFAFGDTKTPLILSVLNLVSNVLLNIVLIGPFGAAGLALATSISAIIAYVLRLVYLRRTVAISMIGTMIGFPKILIMSILSCGIARMIVYLLALNSVISLLLGALIAIVCYLLIAVILRSEELKFLIRVAYSLLGKGE